MFYIPTSIALVSFKLHGLFSNYISTQMAEGICKDEGKNHLVSLAADTLPSHFTNLTVLQKGTGFPYKVTNLPVFTAILRED